MSTDSNASGRGEMPVEIVQGPFGPMLDFLNTKPSETSGLGRAVQAQPMPLPSYPESLLVPPAEADPWSEGSNTNANNNASNDRNMSPSTRTEWDPVLQDYSDVTFPDITQQDLRDQQRRSSLDRAMAMDNRRTARMFELSRMHAASFELHTGDTLVFIDYDKTNPKDVDCCGISYRSQQLRVDSAKLRATSSSKFDEMLRPTPQYRIKRRRGVVNKLPEGVKYVLDLTPPSEGDELVFQMTELSLTPGIIKWWRSQQELEVEASLVDGHDDVCSCQLKPFSEGADQNQNQDSQSTQNAPDTQSIQNTMATESAQADGVPDAVRSPEALQSQASTQTLAEIPNDENRLNQLAKLISSEKAPKDTPAYRNIPDYCPIRHRTNIIRLLMLIQGKDIAMDSASRVWTLVALAKIFDCASVVRDLVLPWIMSRANTRFIEVLPEEALRISFTLELQDVAQAAFRILVNEFALKEAATTDENRGTNQVTMFGRQVGDPGDEQSNIIQHAARDMIERVSATLTELQDLNMIDNWGIGEWKKLRDIERLLAQDNATLARDALVKVRDLLAAVPFMIADVFRGIVASTEPDYPASYPGMDRDRRLYVDVKNYRTLGDITPTLNAVQKLLCPFIYFELSQEFEDMITPSSKSRHPDTRGRMLQLLVDDVSLAMNKYLLFASEARCPPQWNYKCHMVDLTRLGRQINDKLAPISNMAWRPEWDPPLNLTRHLLLNLSNEEMKYLPLWAGGLNDGTGGVFESFLPPAEMGPNGPGPAYHTGLTIPSAPSSSTGSLTEDLRDLRFAGSTTDGSIDVHDSISTVYNPNRVIADDRSIASESFTLEGSDYQDARFHVPTDGQNEGQILEMMCDASSLDEEERADHRENPALDDDVEMQIDRTDTDDIEVWDGGDSGSEFDSDDTVEML